MFVFLLDTTTNIIIGVVVAFVVMSLSVAIPLCIYKVKKNKRMKESINNKEEIKGSINEGIISALGGKENIKDVNLNRSRVVVSLKDINLANKDELDKLKLSDAIFMSDKIYFTLGESAEEIYNSLKEKLN